MSPTHRQLRLLIGASLGLFACDPGPVTAPESAQRSAPRTAPVSTLPVGPLPTDVDCRGPSTSAKLAKLACSERDAEDAEAVDALYHAFAWASFIAINRPEDRPMWFEWSRDEDQREDYETNVSCEPVDHAAFAPFTTPTWHARPSATVGLPPEDNPVWDQAGARVEFEVLFNDAAGDHFARRGLAGGPVQLAAELCERPNLRNTRWGSIERDKVGALHLKLAWKRLGPGDDRDRFLIDPRNLRRGLVAMHVVVKLGSTGDLWLWSTFGHVDNVEGQHPLFRDPDCGPERCPPNTCPRPGPDGKLRSQIERVIPIAAPVVAVNERERERLRDAGSVLQHYQLIGVQRPEQAFPGDRTVDRSIARPRPELLTSEIFEWDRQRTSCIGCHSMASVWVFDDPDACAGVDAQTGRAPVSRRWLPFAEDLGDNTLLVGAGDMCWQYALAHPPP